MQADIIYPVIEPLVEAITNFQSQPELSKFFSGVAGHWRFSGKFCLIGFEQAIL